MIRISHLEFGLEAEASKTPVAAGPVQHPPPPPRAPVIEAEMTEFRLQLGGELVNHEAK